MSVETKEQILDAAEQLIAEKGIDAVSLRAITAAAQVNLAAVHYHFGSKDALVQKVFERRIGPVNRARLELLDAAEAAAGDGPLPLEDVLRALAEPALRLYAKHHRGRQFMQMCGRIYAEQAHYMKDVFEELFRDTIERFRGAFARALPDLPPGELAWRIHFAVGAMVHTLMESDKLKLFSEGVCDPADADAAIERLVQFCAAGMRAGLPQTGSAEPAHDEALA